MPRELQASDALDQHWEDTTYTYVALLANPSTQHLAEKWLSLVNLVEDCWKGQRGCWREEMAAQAKTVTLNYLLDNMAEEISAEKLNDLRKKNRGWKDKNARDSAEYKLYLRKLRLFELVRLALESQLPEMQHWPMLLEQEDNEELKEKAIPLRSLLTQGENAVQARSKAQSDTAIYRVNEIGALVKHLNQERLSLYAALLHMAQLSNESKGWVDTFFRPTPEPTPDRSEARGKALAILGVLSSRSLAVSEEQQKKILGTSQGALLDIWILKVASAPDVESLLREE